VSNFRFDPEKQKPSTVWEAEQQRLYFFLLVQSLEAKCTRIEPLSAEFEETITNLYRAQEALKYAGNSLCVLRYKEATKGF